MPNPTAAMTGDPTAAETLGTVRRRDRSPSFEAAALHTNGKKARLQRLVYAALEREPLTHEELVIRVGGIERVSPSSVRTRCRELVAAGWVVAADGKRPTLSGVPSTVWRIATDADEIPAAEPEGWRKPTKAGLAAAIARGEWEGVDAELVEIIVRAYLNPRLDREAIADERDPA